MTAFLSPVFGAGAQLFSNQGIVLSGGKIWTYQAGTTTPLSTWTDSTQAVSNANPIILDSAGRLSNEMWLQSGSTYKLILMDSNNNILGTWDNVAGLNDVSTSVTVSEWTATSLTPSYISSTSFSVPGNNTSTFVLNRRVKIAVSAGTCYGYVVSSSFGGGITTVVILPDSTVIDSGISAVNVGLLASTNVSVPQQYLAANAAVSLSSASTVNIGAAGSANITITGVVTITAFDNVVAGIIRLVKFTGILTLTHNGTSLILPGAANITTANGDEAVFRSLGSGNWECINYQNSALSPGNANSATNATNATNVVGSGTISATTTGGAALSVASATNATNATNVVGSGTISATTTGGAALSVASATNSTNATNVTGTVGSSVTGTTQAGQDNSTKISTTAYVDRQHDSQIFTAGGTWTKPSWVMPNMVVEIECWGGGGGGGHSISAGGGGGGGGGSYSCRSVLASSLGATETVTVGAAGIGGASASGGNGGASSLGTIVTAAGGTGGNGGAGQPGTGGPGGSNNGVSVTLWDGSAGGNSETASTNSIFGGGGGGGGKNAGGGAPAGGISVYGGNGGAGANGGTTGPVAGTAPGGGGGGGDSTFTNGADGARGEVRVRILT